MIILWTSVTTKVEWVLCGKWICKWLSHFPSPLCSISFWVSLLPFISGDIQKWRHMKKSLCNGVAFVHELGGKIGSNLYDVIFILRPRSCLTLSLLGSVWPCGLECYIPNLCNYFVSIHGHHKNHHIRDALNTNC